MRGTFFSFESLYLFLTSFRLEEMSQLAALSSGMTAFPPPLSLPAAVSNEVSSVVDEPDSAADEDVDEQTVGLDLSVKRS